MSRGNLSEVYLSIQGEALWVGVPMVFVRTTGCHRRCKYCDTPYALVKERYVRVWHGWREGDPAEIHQNPVAAEQAVTWAVAAAGIHTHWVSITGGEPLLQPTFVATIAKGLQQQGFAVLLETEGGLPDQLAQVLPYVDAVAADLKLPSTTGEALDWDSAKEFLTLVANAPVQACVKLVVTPDIDEEEFKEGVLLVAELLLSCQHRTNPIPLILQPVTPTGTVKEPPSWSLLLSLLATARRYLNDVRIIHQFHKFIQVY